MSEPTRPNGGPDASATDEEDAIRQRVRELTSSMLRAGRIDPAAAKDVMNAVAGGAARAGRDEATAREAFSQEIRVLDDALQNAAKAAHAALEALASKGRDYAESDLKQTLAALTGMQQQFAATVNRVADAASGNLRGELAELALHAERVGTDAGARVAATLGEFASRLGQASRKGAASGLDVMRDYGARTAFLTSGILAGVADALREQAQSKKPR